MTIERLYDVLQGEEEDSILQTMECLLNEGYSSQTAEVVCTVLYIPPRLQGRRKESAERQILQFHPPLGRQAVPSAAQEVLRKLV